MLRLEVPLALPAIADAQGEVEGWLDAHRVPPGSSYRARLLLEELLVDLAEHGRFAGPRLPARIELALVDGELRVVIEDAAEPFNPFAAEEPPPLSLEDDRLGGLGLPLVRRMAAWLDYGRTATGWNRTEFRLPAEG